MSALPVASFSELSLYGDVQESFTANSRRHRFDEVSLDLADFRRGVMADQRDPVPALDDFFERPGEGIEATREHDDRVRRRPRLGVEIKKAFKFLGCAMWQELKPVNII